MMVDGDDWVNTNNLDELILELQEVDSDIIITNYDEYDDVNKKIIKTVTYPYEYRKKYNFKEVSRTLSLSMHATIFKTEILKKNNIILDNCFYTDVEFVLLPIPYVKYFYYFNKSIYVYRVGREGQSVNLKSMQKNIAMHELVFNRLIDYYELEKTLVDKNVSYFMANRLYEMAWTHIVILLSYQDKQHLNALKAFIKNIKDEHVDIYKILSKKVKFKILTMFNYMFSSIISKHFVNKHN